MNKIGIIAWHLVLFGTVTSAESVPAPITDADFAPVRVEEAMLGQLLFYDPILSGNREVACATCHHPAFGTSDGLSLGLGDGGRGLGTERMADPDNLPEQRVPRNAPALFNLGAHEFTVLFHDGRMEVDQEGPGGLRTPLDADMVEGFASLLSAQTMFPVLSPDEMAGHYSENDVSIAVRRGMLTGDGGAWDIIAKRVAAIPDYAVRFTDIYPHIGEASEIEFSDISNAIAAFMALEWRSDNSPFDAVLRGEGVLTEPAGAGMKLFYGIAGCSTCHSGPFLTDHTFHATGAPQLGPGKAARFEDHAKDEGRFRVTGNPADLYAFRTPSLRNVAITGPYGHAGAYSDLTRFVAAHANPISALETYDISEAVLPALDVDDGRVTREPSAIIHATTMKPTVLSDEEVDALVAFLNALTDPMALVGGFGVPSRVPSGLPVPRLK